jgi:GNAT superfamily N-acetyltransferase
VPRRRARRATSRLRALHLVSLGVLALPYGAVWSARCPATGRPVGAIAVLRPDRPVPPQVWARAGAQQADLLGPRADAAAEAERAVEEIRPTEPVLVVATVGVAPDHRRRGLARRLLQPALALADELDAPGYLETSTRENVTLYGSAGFAVTAHLRVPGGGPQVWAMGRPARARGSSPAPGGAT